jgi:hypothetical protein
MYMLFLYTVCMMFACKFYMGVKLVSDIKGRRSLCLKPGH